MTNPLISDRDVDFLLYEVLNLDALFRYERFTDHDRQGVDLFLGQVKRLAREVLFPAYRDMDQSPPTFANGGITVHPRMKEIYPRLVELGMTTVSGDFASGGQQMPLTVMTLASAYLMAANLSAYGYIGLTAGASHLIEVFGNEWLKKTFLEPLHDGRFTGTMALTEPQAGSSLADVQCRAVLVQDGVYKISGAKLFISGGDHDLTENIVHMVLARIENAPPGVKGISLFAVPKKRPEGAQWVTNDVAVSGMIHKIGWRGLPSLALSFGENNDCLGYLVGAAHQGLKYMFQMMNEARLMVGMNGVATASVAFFESLNYAKERQQGRSLTSKDPNSPPVAIIEHTDVKRMLLRQKAIVDGGLALCARTAYYADLANVHPDASERARYGLLVDLLTPVTKSFPAEKGFESNALAVQIHGGYGYSSEYLVEAWLRDQKLNSIHEGTTGIQSLDLLGRKVMAQGGEALKALAAEITKCTERARSVGLDAELINSLEKALSEVGSLTIHLGGLGLQGAVEQMLLHSADYLELFSTLVIAWQHVESAVIAHSVTPTVNDQDFYKGKTLAAQYYVRTELPKIYVLAALCRSCENSYAQITPGCF